MGLLYVYMKLVYIRCLSLHQPACYMTCVLISGAQPHIYDFQTYQFVYMLDVHCKYCTDAVVGLYSIGFRSTGSEALFAVSCEGVVVWYQHNLRGLYGKCCPSVHADTCLCTLIKAPHFILFS